MSTITKTVQVYLHVETEKSIVVLVDLILSPEGIIDCASRLEWFPTSICSLVKKEEKGKLPAYFLTAPEWLLKAKKVKYE